MSEYSKYLVSVIIPAYNAENYIYETLKSVQNQTHSLIEVIIVNDGSTDRTEDKIKLVKDERFKYYSILNSGQCKASNFGLSKANGDYIKFLDADDILNPEHIESQLIKINGSESKLASCAWGRFYDENPFSASFSPETVWQDMKPIQWLKSALTQKYDMMPGWLWLIPKKLINKSGGWNEDLSLNNDFEFSIRLLLNSDEVLFCENAKLYYRSGLSQTLSQQPSKERYQDAFLSTKLGCQYLIAAQNSKDMRLICANRFQLWIHRIYPEHLELVKKFETERDIYGGSNRKIEGGKFYKLLCGVLGWKNAKKIKLFLDKYFR